MSEEKDVVYAERADDGIEVLYLNQPRKKNALSGDMMGKLDALLRAADDANDVRVVVLRGAGQDFSSGGDLNQGPALEPGPEGARKTLRRYLSVVRTMRTIAKPVVAMVDGYAVGGAFALACASDLVCASDRALFVPAFCQIGIIPEMGMMKLLPDLVGPQRAKELLFFGGKIPAQQLQAWGLVNRVFPAATLEEETLAFARELAAMPDASIQITKNIMNALADSSLEACLEAESTASPFCTTTKAYAATMEKFAR
ncbi:enoyl-CoA hydratase/isomerase family protein [Eggerthella sinensis]|uniref:Enoyl-CoA hydratase/isomerase family protein n=1 Tax=Eggerthella sinensis TaxID=242230 RepID=A0A3N0J1I7_9ACTN|nr:enoyl-CoA hydratase/isomerase family protein [Eggerthella sinensis]RDB69308.1 enoyl-CoA hydratase/isomerase family protein [Eggerthella sinensis]RNM43027.1 enoyl-CoA hydratase/isomerase family protein [Eggerthella sinensis]